MVDGVHDWYLDTPEDIEVINVVAHDQERNPASVEVAKSWAEFHGTTWVTLADTEGEWIEVWGDLNDPKPAQTYVVLNSQGHIVWIDYHADSNTKNAIIANAEAADE